MSMSWEVGGNYTLCPGGGGGGGGGGRVKGTCPGGGGGRKLFIMSWGRGWRC